MRDQNGSSNERGREAARGPHAFAEADLEIALGLADLVEEAIVLERETAIARAEERIARILAGATVLADVFPDLGEAFRAIVPWDRLSVLSVPDGDGMAVVVAA